MSTESTKKHFSIHPLALLFLCAIGFFFMVCMLLLGLVVRQFASDGLFSSSKPSIGVIEIVGEILDSKRVIARLEKAQEDQDIKGVVLRLNSPGGAVAPSQEIYQYVKSFKKPIVVSMASVAASGAFYIAVGAPKVFANPGTITGSIGVIIEFVNLAKLYEFVKVRRYSVKTGVYKDAGAEYRELTLPEKELFQKMVQNVLDQFKVAIQDGRHLTSEQVNAIADGRIFSGEQAKILGLVDELGGIQEAINDVAKTANIVGKPKVVYLTKPRKPWMDFILDDSIGSDESTGSIFRNLQQFVHRVSPRAGGMYFLWQAF
jgi:protease-4